MAKALATPGRAMGEAVREGLAIAMKDVQTYNNTRLIIADW